MDYDEALVKELAETLTDVVEAWMSGNGHARGSARDAQARAVLDRLIELGWRPPTAPLKVEIGTQCRVARPPHYKTYTTPGLAPSPGLKVGDVVTVVFSNALDGEVVVHKTTDFYPRAVYVRLADLEAL